MPDDMTNVVHTANSVSVSSAIRPLLGIANLSEVRGVLSVCFTTTQAIVIREEEEYSGNTGSRYHTLLPKLDTCTWFVRQLTEKKEPHTHNLLPG